MIDKPIDKPLEYSISDKPLFEYVPFKKSRAVYQPVIKRLHTKFHSNIIKNKPLFTNTNPKKQIVIKNIGTMNRTHTLNAIKYTLKSSSLDSFSFGNDLDFGLDTNTNSTQNNLAFNELGELVNLNQIIDDWHSDCFSNDRGKKALHLVFSLKESQSDSLKDILQNAVKETLQANLNEYKYIMIPHSHQNKPHLHIIINRSNIFNGKKLHFDSKESLANFYDTLREDFAYNLFIYSQGKLDYTNEVCNKDFRVALLNKKIQDLENTSLDNSNATISQNQFIQNSFYQNQSNQKIFTQTPPNHSNDLDSNALKQDIDSIALQKKAMDSLESRAKSLSLEKANLERELKNKQIYLNNVSKKIESTLSQGKNPTSLIAKKDLLKDEIQTLQVKISYTSHDISEINKGFKQLFDSNESFKDFTKHFNSFHKKKALLSSFNGFEKYLSKDLITKLNYIKAEVSQSQFALNQHFQTLQSSIYTMLKSNQQSNTYTLSKNFYKLKRYKSIVRALEFSDSTSQANKSKALLDLTQIEQELRALILQRMEFLRLETANSKALISSYYDKNQQSYDENPTKFIESMLANPKSFKEYKTLCRIHKKLVVLDKELAMATKLCKKLEIIKTMPKEQQYINNENIESFSTLKNEVNFIIESKQKLEQMPQSSQQSIKQTNNQITTPQQQNPLIPTQTTIQNPNQNYQNQSPQNDLPQQSQDKKLTQNPNPQNKQQSAQSQQNHKR